MFSRNPQFDIVTIGGATRDIMFYSSNGKVIKGSALTEQRLVAFEYGAKILADKLYISFGGGAANVAVNCASMGLKTALIARVGNDDLGESIIDSAHRQGVETRFVTRDPKHDSGFSMILTLTSNDHEHVAFLHRGANNALAAADLPQRLSTRWVYVSSLPERNWLPLMQRAISYKLPLAWNPGRAQLVKLSTVKKILPHIESLHLNKDEALEFFKITNVRALIKKIQKLGPKIVVITDANKGAHVASSDEYYFMKAKSVKRVDSIGVGDAFHAAFVSALAKDKSLPVALKWGIHNAAAAIAKIGAQNGMLTKVQIEKL